MAIQSYTYRNGRKILLEKKPDEFVVRALPQELQHLGFEELEQVSSASTRVRTLSDQVEPMMSLSRYIGPTHHAYLMAETGQEFLITDRILVDFKAKPSKLELSNFVNKYALIRRISYSEKTFLFQLTDHTGMNPCKLVVELMEENDNVTYAEHDLNYQIEKFSTFVPNDPEYNQQWYLHQRKEHPEVDPRSSSNCEQAWQLLGNYGSEDVVIGMADDGCRLDHPDFGKNKFAGWGYFEGIRLINHLDIDGRAEDMHLRWANHGTASAGVAAAKVNASHTTGAAPGCRLLPVRWESNGPFLAISDSKLLNAINFMADKVDIMSNSWGRIPISLWWPEIVERIKTLSETGGRRGKGIVFLWAAGNNNCPIDHEGDLDIPYSTGWSFKNDGSRSWIGVQTSKVFRNNLTDIPGVMHIAALASHAQRSHYSNYGKGISLCAPSSNVHTYHRMELKGLNVITSTGSGGGITRNFGGTSSATPLVAGVAALMISANPALSALEIISILKQTASKDLDFNSYSRTLPAPYDKNPNWDISPISPFDDGTFQDIGSEEGTWSPWFGYGKVEAAEAVKAALQLVKDGKGEASTVIRLEAQPQLAIPDNNPQGLKEVLQCTADKPIQDISVEVEVKHSYIGDLIITLLSPHGDIIPLWNRNGGGKDNLKETFTLNEVAELGALIGKSSRGDWFLSVSDNANLDVGTLEKWALEFKTTQSDRTFEVESTPALRIPDNTPEGVSIAFDVKREGLLKDLEIDLDITHPYIGDLTVLLVSPNRKEVFLHHRIGGGGDNIIKTFKPDNTPTLHTLIEDKVQGEWRIFVSDHSNFDEGKWNLCRLRFTV